MSNQIENMYHPDFVTKPGETLLDVLEERDMSQAELSRRMGRPKKTINEIIQGKAAITPETALQLEKVLSIPAHFWTSRQQQYDQHLALLEEREKLGGSIEWLKMFPIKQMVDEMWIEKRDDDVAQLSELLKFFGIATVQQWQPVGATSLPSFRKTMAFESEAEHISTWLRMGEILGSRVTCGDFDKKAFEQILVNEIRPLTMEPPQIFEPRLKSLCSQVGIVVVFVPQLPKARVSGATRWLSSTKALIQLSIRYKKADQMWFSFFHEAAHILLHGKRDIFIESDNITFESQALKEEEADRLAAEILIPHAELVSFLDSLRPGRLPSKMQIIEFASRIGIAPGIVVGRMQHDKLPIGNPTPYTHYHDLRPALQWKDES